MKEFNEDKLLEVKHGLKFSRIHQQTKVTQQRPPA